MSVTVFGGGAVQTAYVSFVALDISVNSITLVWPTSYFDVSSELNGIFYNVLAASLTVNNSNLNLNTVTLPDATESSVGSNFIVTNIGVRAFNLLKSGGDTLISIDNFPGSNSYWVQLIDNSSSAGIWQFVQFGAGTSQAQASTLAGNGLVALGPLLNTNIPVKSINVAPYTVLVDDRAKLLLWQTGEGTMNLPLIGSVPSGFYISVNNEGSGELTIIGNADIDNDAFITIVGGQSLSIISDGSKWWSLGRGQNADSSNFLPGSAINPSITFTSDAHTGIYYYNTAFPPVTPPGIGFSVGSAPIGNITASGLYMNSGKNIVLQDLTGVSETSLTSNASYGQISWTQAGLLTPPTLNITGTNTSSTLELGPFGILTFSQSDTNAFLIYNGNLILNTDAAGTSVFPNNVGFQNTGSVTFNGLASFNNTVTLGIGAPLVCNGTATFNGTSTFNGSVTLSTPLPIASGGTGQNNRTAALNALLPPAPPIGSMIYYDHTNNWVVVSPGIIGNTLTLVDDGFGNPVPKWA